MKLPKLRVPGIRRVMIIIAVRIAKGIVGALSAWEVRKVVVRCYLAEHHIEEILP